MSVVNNPPAAAEQRSRFTLELDGTSGKGELASPTCTLFTITGDIIVRAIVGVCSEDLASAGGGTLALGVTGITTQFIGATTATAIDNGEIWVSTTPTAAAIALPTACKDIVVTAAAIIATVGTADITNGTIIFDVFWDALTDGATLS